jgi:hypothetical protein
VCRLADGGAVPAQGRLGDRVMWRFPLQRETPDRSSLGRFLNLSTGQIAARRGRIRQNRLRRKSQVDLAAC